MGSYSTALNAIDPYRQMFAGACLAPNDCWFGGSGLEGDATGERRGAFHLHWDGLSLTTVYAPQGRGVTDAEVHDGVLYETVVVGPRPNNPAQPDLFEPEDQPRLIHRIEQGAFVNDPFLPVPVTGVPADGSELLALDSDGTDMWAAGGGAASGPAAVLGPVQRPPLIARLVEGVWQEVTPAEGAFGPTDRIVDIAAVPGADHAWAAIATPGQHRVRDRRADRPGRHGHEAAGPAGGSGPRVGGQDRVHLPGRRVACHVAGLAVPLHRRDRAAAGHRSGLRQPDHLPPQRSGRAVHPGCAAGRRLRALQAAAARGGRRAAAGGGAPASAAAARREGPRAGQQALRPLPARAPRAGGAGRAAQGKDRRPHAHEDAAPRGAAPWCCASTPSAGRSACPSAPVSRASPPAAASRSRRRTT